MECEDLKSVIGCFLLFSSKILRYRQTTSIHISHCLSNKIEQNRLGNSFMDIAEVIDSSQQINVVVRCFSRFSLLYPL